MSTFVTSTQETGLTIPLNLMVTVFGPRLYTEVLSDWRYSRALHATAAGQQNRSDSQGLGRQRPLSLLSARGR